MSGGRNRVKRCQEEEECQGRVTGWDVEPAWGRVSRREQVEEELGDRVWRLEAGESGGEGASWGCDARRDGEWREWQQWDGVWWIRVGHTYLNSRQRRQVSRGLKRLVAREQNEVIKLLRELKSAIWKGNELAEAIDGTNQRDKSSEGETKKIGGDDDDDETWSMEGSNRDRMRSLRGRNQQRELKRGSGQY